MSLSELRRDVFLSVLLELGVSIDSPTADKRLYKFSIPGRPDLTSSMGYLELDYEPAVREGLQMHTIKRLGLSIRAFKEARERVKARRRAR